MAEYLQLDELKRKLDSVRPIPPERLQAVIEKFRLDWTYHSNALEGNPLTLSETSFFVREGLTSKGKPLAAYLEVKNHIAALDFLETVVQQKLPVNENLLKQYHAMLFDKIDYMEIKAGTETKRIKIEPGKFKTQNNHVIRMDGQIREFTDWLQVPGEIERLFAEMEEKKTTLHPIELAGIFHHRLTSLHPFIDGNGRVARLVMNTVLMQAGYTPAIIPVEDKKRYLEALQAADDGTYEPLVRMLEGLVDKSLRLVIDVVEGREAFDFDDLARMVRNIAEQTRAIELELGPATEAPEQRASRTAAQIRQVVVDLLNNHVQKVMTPEIPVRLNAQAPLLMFPQLQSFLHQFPNGTPLVELGVGPAKRFVPSLVVDFRSASARSQVGLAGYKRIGHLNEHFAEELDNDPPVEQLVGSIYIEDWDRDAISEFVLKTLKVAYKLWNSEMDRRKSVIAAQELELTKLRPIK